MVHIVIATGNPHKVRELTQVLRVPGIRWHSLIEYPRLRRLRETGTTFDANAIAKARAVAKATGFFALADDSGIEVEALGGAPGVRSARFAGRHGDDVANNQKLLRVLAGRPPRQRRARYRCSLALVSPQKLIAITRGTWSGWIAEAPAGHHGFGYDPIFSIPQFHRTVGQLPVSVKRRLSHRAMAARRMRRILAQLVAARG